MQDSSPNFNPQIARAEQIKLAQQIILKNSFKDLSEIKTIATLDIALESNPRFAARNSNKNKAYVACIVFSFPEFEIIGKYHHLSEINIPYISGFLSFRESPAYLELIAKHQIDADLYIFDGHGIAHPRSLGIASHMGLLLKKPSIGCAKSLLYGKYDQALLELNKQADLNSPKNELLGFALQTKAKIKPVFVSAGHLIDQITALAIIKTSIDNYRIPKATRLVDQYSKEIKLIL